MNKKQILIDLYEYEALKNRIKYLEQYEPKKVINKGRLIKDVIDETELTEYENIAYSFFVLFKSNLNEMGIVNTTTLDKAKLLPWTNHIKKIIELDKRTNEELREVYKFLQSNKFWKTNIQSTSKLRDQFEKLLFQSRQESTVNVKKKVGVSEEWLNNLKNDIQEL